VRTSCKTFLFLKAHERVEQGTRSGIAKVPSEHIEFCTQTIGTHRLLRHDLEAWSVALDKQPDGLVDTLVDRREQLKEEFIVLMNQREFDSAISQGTGDPNRVQLRFSAIERLIDKVLS